MRVGAAQELEEWSRRADKLCSVRQAKSVCR
jgi:hypothetical protein